jgi:hypothetical protein
VFRSIRAKYDDVAPSPLEQHQKTWLAAIQQTLRILWVWYLEQRRPRVAYKLLGLRIGRLGRLSL